MDNLTGVLISEPDENKILKKLEENGSSFKCGVLLLLAANYPTHSYVAMLILYYFIKFLEKDTSVLPFLLLEQ